MSLSKMKDLLVAIVFLISLQSNAQIPDSLGVDLPWDVVRFSSCEDTMGEGPRSDVDIVFIQLESDDVEEDDSGNCLIRTRKWNILNWEDGELYKYTQQGLINFPEPLLCNEDIYIPYDQLPYILNKDNVLLSEDENHEYSFDYNDIDDTEIEIALGSTTNYELFMYDHTANRVCKTNVYITNCEDDIVINVPEAAEIEFNGEPYIELTLEMLGVEIEYPCHDYTTRIRIGNQSNGILSSQNVGKIVQVSVEMNVDNGFKYKNYIDVSATGFKPDPISMYIEDKSFIAGELIALEVWAEGIPGLVAWQLQLDFQDAEVLALETSEIFSNIPENIFDEGKSVRGLWFPLDGLPFDAESDVTWFTLIIKPEIDGSTFDIFKPEQASWNQIVIEDENYVHQIDAEFVFNIVPRDLLDVGDDVQDLIIKTFPNPSSNKVSISGLPNLELPVNISVYDLEGRLILTETSARNTIVTIDISDLPPGLYVLKSQNGKFQTSQKISKF